VFGFEIKEKEIFNPQLWTKNVGGSSFNQEIINIQGLPNRTQEDLLSCCLKLYSYRPSIIIVVFSVFKKHLWGAYTGYSLLDTIAMFVIVELHAVFHKLYTNT